MKLDMSVLEFFLKTYLPNHANANHDDYVLECHFTSRINGNDSIKTKYVDELVANIAKKLTQAEKSYLDAEKLTETDIYQMQYESITNTVNKKFESINASAKANQDLVIDVLGDLELLGRNTPFGDTIVKYRSEYIKKSKVDGIGYSFGGFSDHVKYKETLIDDISKEIHGLNERLSYIENRVELINEFAKLYRQHMRSNPYVFNMHIAYEYESGLMGDREKRESTFSFILPKIYFESAGQEATIAGLLYKTIKEHFGTWHPNYQLECGFFDKRLGEEMMNDLTKNIINIFKFNQDFYYETHDNCIIEISMIDSTTMTKMVV